MEHFQQPRFRALRAAMFAGLGSWGVIPAVHGYMLHHGVAIVEKAVAWDMLMGAVYLVRLRLSPEGACGSRPAGTPVQEAQASEPLCEPEPVPAAVQTIDV